MSSPTEAELPSAEPLFSECEQLDSAVPTPPIRQGDVFAWNQSSGDPWQRMGVVVTANCDIAQEKHGGVLSYVPLLSLPDYLRLFYLPKPIGRALRPLSEELAALVRKHQAANVPEFPTPLSNTGALQWLRDVGSKRVAHDLRIEGPSSAKFISLADNVLELEAVLEAGIFEGQRDALIAFRATKTSVATRETAAAELVQEFARHLAQLPGDCFFVGRVHDTHPMGYVAYLRLVREIRQREIALRYPDLRDSTVKARRIARMMSPYVYRLTQQLAEVFSAIGLPTEYETHRLKVALAVAMPEMAAEGSLAPGESK